MNWFPVKAKTIENSLTAKHHDEKGKAATPSFSNDFSPTSSRWGHRQSQDGAPEIGAKECGNGGGALLFSMERGAYPR